MDLESLHVKWAHATANLNPGEQRVFRDVLTLVAEEKKSNLVWGADYSDGGKGACLVYQTTAMLSSATDQKEGTSGFPMAQFGEVVTLYDRLNRLYLEKDINTNQYVSPLAAEILLHHFAPLKPMPIETIAKESHFKGDDKYVEPTDEEMLNAVLNMLSDPDVAPVDVITPFDVHTDENV